MADSEYTRLHITPFNPSLLNAILTPSILPNARNISYHKIQAFPEKGYGYVELPVMDAEKIKKKLNGSILKGSKVHIEKAKPQKEHVVEPEEPERPKKEKRKRKRDELPGVDIGERHVKRGWTTPGKDAKSTDKKSVVKSKYTTEPECLFKTNLPPNVASKTKAISTEVKSDKKRRKKAGKEALVHEFAKTMKYATFLRGPAGSKKTKVVAEFVEGKGWVDEDGNVVEEVIKKIWHTKTPHTKASQASKTPIEESESSEESADEDAGESSSEDEADYMEIDTSPKESLKVNKVVTDEESSSDESSSEEAEQTEFKHNLQATEATIGNTKEDISSYESSSNDDSSEEDAKLPAAQAKKITAKATKAQSPDSTSESSSSSDSDSDSDSEDLSSDDEPEATEPQSATLIRPQSSSGPSLSIRIPDSSLTSTPVSAVHPLEALYKLPKVDNDATPKPAVPAFSFFGADNDEDEDGEKDDVTGPSSQVPLTPFTRKDSEFRGMRSAAPTPDTAHANKRFIWPTDKDDGDDDEDDDEPSSPIRKPECADKGKEGEKDCAPESDFQKWFWENRGETNRAWKRRKKTAAKEKRQRENRKRQDRAV